MRACVMLTTRWRRIARDDAHMRSLPAWPDAWRPPCAPYVVVEQQKNSRFSLQTKIYESFFISIFSQYSDDYFQSMQSTVNACALRCAPRGRRDACVCGVRDMRGRRAWDGPPHATRTTATRARTDVRRLRRTSQRYRAAVSCRTATLRTVLWQSLELDPLD